MPGNSFGQLFRITTFGESHGGSVGAVVDGCPPGLELSESDIQPELDRRKPGQSAITTQRNEADNISILSGTFQGKTTGTPILLVAQNKDARSQDYGDLKDAYRPSHADYTYTAKYGLRDWRGSGRASARETLARVASGAIAAKYLRDKLGIEIVSYVEQVGELSSMVDIGKVSRSDVDRTIIRCPDEKAAQKMISLVEQVRDDGDSIGGIIRGVIRKVPVGLGEPVFDKFAADLGKAMLSLNAVKGFEFGSGFAGVKMRGSEHNDEFYLEKSGKVGTRTNHSGGTQGGITNGEIVHFRVAFKPVATIMREQKTLNTLNQTVTLKAS
ncbi:MAG: chorismate synthase, partial [Bdellovibrionales bacterium]|nr:chorismate synthase [Bdellovibrionales bacterium]